MARDPDRIDRVLGVLEVYWRSHPELRLTQILGNIVPGGDPYYLEDDEVERYLRSELRGYVRGAIVPPPSPPPPPRTR